MNKMYRLPLLAMLWVMLSSVAYAQVVRVQSISVLPVPEQLLTATGKVAGVAPNGKYVLLTSQSNKGLYRYTVRSKKLLRVTEDEGAGYRVRISDDSRQLTFRSRRVAAEGQQGGKMQQARLRLLSAPVSDVEAVEPPSIRVEGMHMVACLDGVEQVVAPLGEGESYLWPSVSPDRTHLLFYVAGRGAFVSDVKGNQLQFLGADMRAPRWLNDHVVIAMNDTDDGKVVTSSAIVAMDIRDGAVQQLTDAAQKMMFPYADKQGKHIACSADDGTIYWITLR